MKKVDSDIINDYTNKLETKTNYPEVEIIKEFSDENEELYINMDFLGLDLSSVPSTNLTDYKNLVIPFLYVISSIISTKITMKMQNNSIKEKEEGQEESMEEMMQGTTKTMSYMMPVMAFSISLVAPLGLALYWLTNSLLMIVEKLALNKLLKNEEEK